MRIIRALYFLVAVFIFVQPGAGVVLAKGKVKRGDSRERVISRLGKPRGQMKIGKQEILVYPTFEVTLLNGRLHTLTRTQSRPAAKIISSGDGSDPIPTHSI